MLCLYLLRVCVQDFKLAKTQRRTLSDEDWTRSNISNPAIPDTQLDLKEIMY